MKNKKKLSLNDLKRRKNTVKVEKATIERQAGQIKTININTINLDNLPGGDIELP